MASIEKIKAEVVNRGGWESVFCAYSELSKHIATNPIKHSHCPVTGHGKDCFRFFKDWQQTGGAIHNTEGAFPDGIALLKWLTNQSTSQVLKDIEGILGGVNLDRKEVSRINRNLKKQTQNYCTAAEGKARSEKLRRNHRRCISVIGTPGETYLRSRGITMPLDFLEGRVMYNPEMYYGDDNTQMLKLSGLCSMFYGADYKPLTMHRTFLDKDGKKAKVENEKLLFASPKKPTGGCIPLDAAVDTPFGRLIGVCEGLETGLSVRQETGCPMWIGVSTRLMENINCAGVDVVLIWADKDLNNAGQESAMRMQEKLASMGIASYIYLPDLEGKADWNDVLVQQGTEGFPQPLKNEWKVYGGDQ